MISFFKTFRRSPLPAQHPALPRTWLKLPSGLLGHQTARVPHIWSPDHSHRTLPHPYPSLQFCSLSPTSSACQNPAWLLKPWISYLLNKPPQVLLLTSLPLYVQSVRASVDHSIDRSLPRLRGGRAYFHLPPRTGGALKPELWHLHRA